MNSKNIFPWNKIWRPFVKYSSFNLCCVRFPDIWISRHQKCQPPTHFNKLFSSPISVIFYISYLSRCLPCGICIHIKVKVSLNSLCESLWEHHHIVCTWIYVCLPILVRHIHLTEMGLLSVRDKGLSYLSNGTLH